MWGGVLFDPPTVCHEEKHDTRTQLVLKHGECGLTTVLVYFFPGENKKFLYIV